MISDDARKRGGELLPVLRYPGSKARLASWIAAHFPPHQVYCEPFAGSLAVLFAKPRTKTEIVNDLDGRITNLFQVIRDRPGELADAIAMTPYSKDEYLCSEHSTGNPVEAARRFLVRTWQGIGADMDRLPSWKATRNPATGTPQAMTWRALPERILAVADRLRGVQIDNRPAQEVIAACRYPEALIYADPPYVLASRHRREYYRHEMTDTEHGELLAALEAHPGHVLLSGYPSPLYAERLRHWSRWECRCQTVGNSAATEVLWLNRRAAGAVSGRLPGLEE